MGPACYRRFVGHVEDYINAVTKEAEYREENVVLDMDSFETLRRENSAVRCCFGLFGYVLGLDLPDEIFYHPDMMAMHLAAVDMVCWSNVSPVFRLRVCIINSLSFLYKDIYSYDMEQAMGHTTNNIMTVLMKAKNTDLQGASNHVGDYFKVLMDRYLDHKAKLPSFGPEMETTVSQFIMAMESWIVGNLVWSFETLRYFGARGEEVKKTLVVELTPKRV